MKEVRLLLMFLMFFSYSFLAFAIKRSNINFSDIGNNQYQIQYKLDTWSFSKMTKNKKSYMAINLDSSVKTEKKGYAEIPYSSISIKIHNFLNYKPEIVSSTFEDYPLELPLLPSRGVIYRNQDPDTIDYSIDKQSIVDQWYPGNLVDKSTAYLLRDVRGINVYFYPFQYNSKKKILRVYSSVTIKLVPVRGASENPLTVQKRKVFSVMNNIYSSIFINYKSTKELKLEEFGDILVIYPNKYKDAIRPYVEWKRMKGHKVHEQEVQVGTNVKDLIKNFYNSNNDLLYVQLVGDWEDIKSDRGPSGAPTDPMLGRVVGTDYYVDIIIGRFPAKNSHEVSTQVEKTIRYERDLLSGENSWLKNAIGIASDEGSGIGDDEESDQEHMESIRLNRLLKYDYHKVYQDYQNSGINALEVGSQIDNGVGLINYVGHGSATSWSTSGFNNGHIDTLTNGRKLPFIVSVACVNGAFHKSYDSFAETWLKKENGGAIATWMSTINQPWVPPMRGQDYFNDLLIGGYNYDQKPGHGINVVDQRTTFGSLTMNATHLMFSESSENSDLDTIRTWVVFGDASLTVRTDDPQKIMVSESPIYLGAPFTVNIKTSSGPVEKATVSLYQNGKSYVVSTDDQGDAFIEQDLSVGKAYLVITGYNLETKFEEINVLPPGGAYLSLKNYSVNESTTKNVLYGSNSYLNLEIKNIGNTLSESITAEISTSSPYVDQIIGDDIIHLGNIGNEEIKIVNKAFQFKIKGLVPDQTIIPFQIILRDKNSRSTYQYKVYLKVLAPKFTYHYIVEGANTINPGEVRTFNYTVKNVGHADTKDLIGILTEKSSLNLKINNNQQQLGVLKMNESKILTYTIEFPQLIPSGTTATLNLSVNHNSEILDQFNNSVIIGITENFESGQFSPFWKFAGKASWVIDSKTAYEGSYSAKSGKISNNKTSELWMEVEYASDGKVSFYKKISSEKNYDKLYFYIDGKLRETWSGELDWSAESFNIPAGKHQLRWVYRKDYSVSKGKDAVWIDRIMTTGGTPVIK